MSELERYICLSDMEFTTLITAAGRKSFVCFQVDQPKVASQNDYVNAVFSLYQRGIIENTSVDAFSVTAEYKPMLSLLTQADQVLQIVTKDGRAPEYCIYSDGEQCVLATPGTRQDEYIKLMMGSVDRVMSILQEEELIPVDIMDARLVEDQKELPIEDEALLAVLDQDGLIQAEALGELASLDTLFTVRDAMTGEEQRNTAVIWQPLQNKILDSTQGQTDIMTYSAETMGAIVHSILEV